MHATAKSPAESPPARGQAGVSLARLLLLWLLVPQLVVWLAGGVASYRLASGYVNEAIDASLLQASRALARQLKPIGSGLLIDFPKAAQDILEADPSDRLLYTVSSPPGQFILGNQSLPLPQGFEDLPLGEPHFYSGSTPAQRGGVRPQALRMAALRLALGDEPGQPTMLVQVARSSANREELAERILVDMLLPMSGLVLLLTLLVWAGIRAGLAPLHRLRLQVEGRAPTDLAPLQLASAPRELWSLASALNTLLAAVQRNVDTQKRFIGDAAHQLRTPLAVLKTQVQSALRGDMPAEQALHEISDTVDRATQLANQMLALAKVEQLRQQSEPPITRLDEVLRTVALEISPLIAQRDLDFGIHTEAAPVRAHEWMLRELTRNLLHNAVRHAPQGSELAVDLRCDAHHTALTISDCGPGIEPELAARLFQPFSAGDVRSGSGLGLAICQEIVQALGGSITLTNREQGTRILGLDAVVRLPLAHHFASANHGNPAQLSE